MEVPIKAIGDVLAGTAKQYTNLKFGAKDFKSKIFETEALIMKKVFAKNAVFTI